MSLSENKPRRLRRTAAALAMMLGLTVGGSLVSPGAALADGCVHYSHYVWNYDHYDYDSYQGTSYYWNGSRYVHYHHWLRYHPSFVEHFHDCFF